MGSKILLLATLAAGALGQTPPGTSPSVNTPLKVQFGATSVSPGLQLPLAAVASQPAVSSNDRHEGRYMVFMIDQSVRKAQVAMNASAADSLVTGTSPDRTTLLHWWSGNLTQAADGSFAKADGAGPDVAPYLSPGPPAGDVAHAYALYLLPQPDGYTLPPAAAAGVYARMGSAGRTNFSLENAVVSKVGQPLAGNYFLSANMTNSSATPTGGAGTGSTSATNAPIATAAATKLAAGSALAGVGALALGFLAM